MGLKYQLLARLQVTTDAVSTRCKHFPNIIIEANFNKKKQKLQVEEKKLLETFENYR